MDRRLKYDKLALLAVLIIAGLTCLRVNAAAQEPERVTTSPASGMPTGLGQVPVTGQAAPGKSDAAKDSALRWPTLRDLRHWGAKHGLAVVVIVVVVAGILWLASMLQGHVVKLLAGGEDRSNREEREKRARTLVSVLNNALRTAAIVAGAIMVLEEFAVPVGPLLGGVAVAGLAVAFGAQSLIKDYFTGFMVLLEQQYVLGDVIKIGEISGQVENITLRLTVLRDFEGRVHFIPHGQITTVTNLTHGWSRAVFDVGIAYDEDADRVIGVLVDLARDLRADPLFGPMILEDASMLGVDTLGDSSVVIKFGIKTRPTKQWDVKREMLRRIKRRFDELGIEIPYPQRTVWVREENSGSRAQRSGEVLGGAAEESDEEQEKDSTQESQDPTNDE